jgi:hypothetical protein
MDDDDWGYAIMADGTHVPLQPPQFAIPEDEREYIIRTPRLTLWTRRTNYRRTGEP